MRHTTWRSALTYDEMNIHVKGWVIMKWKCAKVNEWGDKMKRGECERREKGQMSLSKCCQNVLTYETVKLMRRPVSMNTLIKVLKLMHA